MDDVVTKAAAVATFKALRAFCERIKDCEDCAFGSWCAYTTPDGLTDEKIDIIAEKITEEVVDD